MPAAPAVAGGMEGAMGDASAEAAVSADLVHVAVRLRRMRCED